MSYRAVRRVYLCLLTLQLSAVTRGRGVVARGLQEDVAGVDATIAFGALREGLVGLITFQHGAVDIEELGADAERAVRVEAAVDPCGGAVGSGLAHAEHAVDGAEAEAACNVPQRRSVVGVEHHLKAGDAGTRHTRDGVDGLLAVEEGELVAFVPVGVVDDEGHAELGQGGGGVDDEATEAEVGHQDIVAVGTRGDAGQGAAGDLVGCQHAAAVEAHLLGDVYAAHTHVGLHEGVVVGHAVDAFEGMLEGEIELRVDAAEVGHLGTLFHLFLAAAGSRGLGG